jgi:drug/metabolite transporter (DMT)-like permease
MNLNPYLEVIIAAIIGGTNGVFIKLLNLPPTTISFFRLAIPVIGLFIYFKIKKIKLFDIENKKLLLLVSFVFGIKTMLMVLGLQLTPLSTAIIVLYTWPIFTTIFSSIILKEKIAARNIYLLALAFIGIIFIFFNQTVSFANLEFLGLFLMLLTAALHALVVVFFKQELGRSSKYKTIFYQNFLGFFMFLPFIFINQPYPTLMQTGFGVTYGLLIGLILYIFFFSALKNIKASTASHLMYIEVISAVLFGVIIFKDVLTWNSLVGGVLIIASAYFLKK